MSSVNEPTQDRLQIKLLCCLVTVNRPTFNCESKDNGSLFKKKKKKKTGRQNESSKIKNLPILPALTQTFSLFGPPPSYLMLLTITASLKRRMMRLDYFLSDLVLLLSDSIPSAITLSHSAIDTYSVLTYCFYNSCLLGYIPERLHLSLLQSSLSCSFKKCLYICYYTSHIQKGLEY